MKGGVEREKTRQIECYYRRTVRKKRQDTVWHCKLCTNSIGLPVGFCNNSKRKCYLLFKYHKAAEDGSDCDEDIDL